MSVLPAAAAAALAVALTGLPAGLAWRRERRARRRYQHHATHDDLTGLPNRRAILHHLSTQLLTGQPTGVILLDLDLFKSVNDTYGHAAGNLLLTAVGERLSTLVTPAVFLGRLHGDEFVFITSGDRDRTSALALTVTRALTHEPFLVGPDQRPVRVSGSVGYAQSALGLDAPALLRLADESLYEAKDTQRGSVHGVATTASRRPHAAGSRPRDQRRHPTEHER
ncbi:GGDEF domain-containing protein [Cryptosporangium phraense]|uniref:GGDEF domain-containing protein n=1 Tax=Cryptosporangium phraense TaxID=2593070 RepID=A0A545ANB5_9ACTN|nr:GGDEF domain-containing protein [Cryptosporangium phraense]TQS42834.1 GGDEF domain-containing protein [Cryptosporangium phraense]